ncbi:MAG: anti-sigma F factor [Clostridia bacterium]|nr:anti-sigma F factor [Clostridia bacterium]
MKKGRFSGAVINKMQLKLPALSANEGMARAAVAAFCSQLDPAAVEIADIKCAVSEAVTNCIVHAYKNRDGWIYITVSLLDGRIAKIEIKDRGCGIEDVKEARQPLFTTDAASERSGMGFTVMESFTDAIRVTSRPGRGTNVIMYKAFGERGDI